MEQPSCEGCPLVGRPGHTFVPGSGSTDSELMIIGEQPGANEARQGAPFVGESGKVLRKIMSAVKLDPNSAYITNAIKCYVAHQLSPTEQQTAIAMCLDKLAAEIQEVKPKYVITAGSVAQQAIDGRKVTETRGFVQDFHGMQVINTYHPAALFRVPENFDLFALDLAKMSRLMQGKVNPPTVNHKVVTDFNDIREVSKLADAEMLSFDIETASYDVGEEILCVQLYDGKGTVWVIPWTDHAAIYLKPILEGPSKKIGQNLMFDVAHMKNVGIEVNNLYFDTMVGHHLVRNYLPHGLNTLVSIYTDMPKYDDDIKQYLPHKTTKFTAIPKDKLYYYGACDAFAVWEIVPKLMKELEELNLLDYFFNNLMPLLDVCIKLRFRGVKIDLPRAKRVAEQIDLQMKSTEETIFQMVGRRVNLNSPPQMGVLLYDTLGLPCTHFTKKGARSANKTALQDLKGQHEVVDSILAWRKNSKLRSTFLKDEMFATIEQDPNNRIYTSYKVTGTATSRLSSEKPNLQNIPRGETVRSIFIAEPTFKFVTVDYSQAELRVAAYLAGDETMIGMFESGQDIHALTASQILRKDITTINKEERVLAKFLNFGVAYGRGWHSIMNQYKVSADYAKEIYRSYAERFPRLMEWFQEQIRFAKKHRYIIAPGFGRRRWFPLFGQFMSEWEREVRNFIPQAVVADITNRSMVLLERFFNQRRMRSRLVMNLHDAIMFEVHQAELDDALYAIKKIMELPIPGTNIVIPIDVEVGDRWVKPSEEEEEDAAA